MEQNATYVNRSIGTVRLFVDGVELTRSSFRRTFERQAIMKKWKNAFRNIAAYGKVSMQVSHFEMSLDKQKSSRETRRKSKNRD
jgi:hypothetical protein